MRLGSDPRPHVVKPSIEEVGQGILDGLGICAGVELVQKPTAFSLGFAPAAGKATFGAACPSLDRAFRSRSPNVLVNVLGYAPSRLIPLVFFSRFSEAALPFHPFH